MFDLEDFPVKTPVLTPTNRRGQVVKHLHWQKGATRNDLPFDRVVVRYDDDGDTVTISPELLRHAPPPVSIPASGQLMFDFA